MNEAAKFHANTWWWLKADACDLVSGLLESMRGVWSGDIDLNDGGLDKQYENYKGRLSCIQSLKIRDASDRDGLHTQLNTIAQQVKDDLQFLHTSKCNTPLL